MAEMRMKHEWNGKTPFYDDYFSKKDMSYHKTYLGPYYNHHDQIIMDLILYESCMEYGEGIDLIIIKNRQLVDSLRLDIDAASNLPIECRCEDGRILDRELGSHTTINTSAFIEAMRRGIEAGVIRPLGGDA